MQTVADCHSEQIENEVAAAAYLAHFFLWLCYFWSRKVSHYISICEGENHEEIFSNAEANELLDAVRELGNVLQENKIQGISDEADNRVGIAANPTTGHHWPNHQPHCWPHSRPHSDWPGLTALWLRHTSLRMQA